MIRITVEYTDNLGPEAEIGTLLRKMAALVREERPELTAQEVRVAGHRLTEFVIGDVGDHWAWLEASVCGPDEPNGEAVRERLLTLIDAHFAELYPRRSIYVAVRPQPAPEDVIERIHEKSAAADDF